MQRTPDGLIVGRFCGWWMYDRKGRPVAIGFTLTAARQLRVYRRANGWPRCDHRIMKKRSRPIAHRRYFTKEEAERLISARKVSAVKGGAPV